LGQFTDWLRRNPKRHPAEPETWIIYYASLKRRRLSVYTRKGHFHILNRFGTWLLKKGYLRAHPLTEVSAPELPKDQEPKAIYREHIQAMLGAADNLRDRTILLFFRDTGCRATEAVTLTWGDIQLDERKAITQGKGNKQRKFFFKPITRRALKSYRGSVPHKKTDPVWWGPRGPLGYDGLYKIFKRLAEKVDVGDENFNPHAWRHAFGRDTTMAGIPTVQLQDLMGHSSIEVTKIYTQFDSDELQEAHDRYSPVDGDLDDSSSSEDHDPEESDTEK
jgi:integrase/recombinase XerD